MTDMHENTEKKRQEEERKAEDKKRAEEKAKAAEKMKLEEAKKASEKEDAEKRAAKKEKAQNRRRSRGPLARAASRTGGRSFKNKTRPGKVAFELKNADKGKQSDYSITRVRDFWKEIQKRQAEQLKKARVSTIPAKISYVRIVTDEFGKESVKISFAGGGSFQDAGKNIKMMRDIRRKTPPADRIYLLMMAIKEKGWRAVEGKIPPELREEVMKACSAAGVSLTAPGKEEEAVKQQQQMAAANGHFASDAFVNSDFNEKENNKSYTPELWGGKTPSFNNDKTPKGNADNLNTILGDDIVKGSKKRSPNPRKKGFKADTEEFGVIKGTEEEIAKKIVVLKYLSELYEKQKNGEPIAEEDKRFLESLEKEGITADNYKNSINKISYGKKNKNVPSALREKLEITAERQAEKDRLDPQKKAENLAKLQQSFSVFEKKQKGETLTADEEKLLKFLTDGLGVTEIEDLNDPKKQTQLYRAERAFVYVDGQLWDGKAPLPQIPSHEEISSSIPGKLAELKLSAEGKKILEGLDFAGDKKAARRAAMDLLAKEFLPENAPIQEKGQLYKAAKFLGAKGVEIYLHGTEEEKKAQSQIIEAMSNQGERVNNAPSPEKQHARAQNKEAQKQEQKSQQQAGQISFKTKDELDATKIKLSVMKAALQEKDNPEYDAMRKALEDRGIKSFDDFSDETKLNKALNGIGKKAYGFDAWNAIREANGEKPLTPQDWEKVTAPKENEQPQAQQQPQQQEVKQSETVQEKPAEKAAEPKKMSAAELLKAKGAQKDQKDETVLNDQLRRMQSRETAAKTSPKKESGRGAQWEKFAKERIKPQGR